MKFLWFLLRIKGYFFRLDMWNRGRLYFILMALMAVSREAIMGHGSVIWQALRKQAHVFLRLCIKKEFIENFAIYIYRGIKQWVFLKNWKRKSKRF